MRRHPTGARRAVLAATVLLGVLGTGCGVVNPDIGSGAVSDCFKSLPAARTAVHSASAHLLGVHRLTADDFPKRLKSIAGLPAELDTTVCAVAFKGAFAPGQVEDAQNTVPGTYAVVLVDERKLTVVAAYVGTHLPRNLKGRTV